MRHLFQLTVVALQCRDMLHVIKADQEKKYKLPDTLMVGRYFECSPTVLGKSPTSR